MNQRHDVLGFGLLMLAAALVAWLSIVGAPNLKDWQPLIAAAIAFGAGTLAYKGAMAKVTFDRDSQAAEARRKKAAILVRVELQLITVRSRISTALRQIRDGSVPNGGVYELKLEASNTLDEVWQNLELLPRLQALNIYSVRAQLLVLESTSQSDEKNSVKTILLPDRPELKERFQQMLEGVRNDIDEALEWLRDQNT